MKKENIFLAIILLVVITGCGGGKQSTDDLITVDVTKGYPEKELILQDIMDVEYIALESTDEFLCQGLVLDVGKEIILVRNQTRDGNIFIFARNGKGLRKINRMGQGPEEYTSIFWFTLDEENNEMFIDDMKRILVYDLYGKFLRSFPKDNITDFSLLQNFDREHFICRRNTSQINEESTKSQPFAIISKKDGSMVKDMRIRFEKGIDPVVKPVFNPNIAINVYQNFSSIIPFRDSWILTEIASDTIFRLLPDLKMTHFMTRTPPVHTMNPEVFLFPIILTEQYCFLETLRKEAEQRPGFFQKIKLAYDRQEKTIYRYTLLNGDYTTKKTLDFYAMSKNSEIAFWQKIEAHELIDANKKGELKGKLKEVVASLDDDPNPVIMLVTYKK